jgi:hypothetical protein
MATTRLTGKDLLLQWLTNGAAAIHVQHIYFNSTLSGGTFKLRVNGELTAAITFSATAATLVTNINTALDNLPNLEAGDIVASGSAVTDITLTATGYGNGFLAILVDEQSEALTGNTTADPDYTTRVTTIGAALVSLSADASKFSFESSAETVDVTPLSQTEREYLVVADGAKFDISLYKAQTQEFARELTAGSEGWLYVYPEGKVVGKEYYVINAILESNKEDIPDHAVIELNIAGMRSGAFIVPPKSVYR